MADASVTTTSSARRDGTGDQGAPGRVGSSDEGRSKKAGRKEDGRIQDERAERRADLARELASVEGGRWRKRLIWLGLLLAAAAIAAAVWVKTRPAPESRYVTAKTETGDVLETVQSTGQVEPVTEVEVGAQVSGRIAKVHVDFNSQVKQGDVLAEIDPQLFDAQIASTQAQLAATKANVSRAEAAEETAKRKLERTKELVKEGLANEADLDAARGSYDVAAAELSAARAQVTQIGAQLQSTQTNLEYTRIFSPIDGVVVNRAIDPGQTVAASFQAPVLFVIAQDLSKMRVLADIDEADVGRVKEGLEAEVTVDAFPGEPFQGTGRA
jgi:HlyD family secretion protein